MAVVHVSGVPRFRRLEEQDLNFVVSHGAVLDAARDDVQLTRAQFHRAIAKLDLHHALPDEKQFVRVGVMMPGKDALEFYDANFLSIQLSDHLGSPMLGQEGEFVGQISAMDHGW